MFSYSVMEKEYKHQLLGIIYAGNNVILAANHSRSMWECSVSSTWDTTKPVMLVVFASCVVMFFLWVSTHIQQPGFRHIILLFYYCTPRLRRAHSVADLHLISWFPTCALSCVWTIDPALIY